MYNAIPAYVSVDGSSDIAGGKYGAPSLNHAVNRGYFAQPTAYQYMFLTTDLSLLPFDVGGWTLTTQQNRYDQFQVGCSRSWVQSHRQSTLQGIQSPDSYNFTPWDSNAYAQKSGVHTPATIDGVANTIINPSAYGKFSYDTTTQYSNSTVRGNGYTQAFSQLLSNGSFQPMFAP